MAASRTVSDLSYSPPQNTPTSGSCPIIRNAPPWDIDDNGTCFIVRDANGQALSYVYYENEPGQRPPDCSREMSPAHCSKYREAAGLAEEAAVLTLKLPVIASA
jgi:hypothetical protein